MGNIVSEEEMGFIRAVLDNPDDDAVRLIYSDWLEEQGKAFQSIRTQAKELIIVHNSTYDWIKAPRRIWSSLDVGDRCETRYEKLELIGFLEYIRCPAEWWMKNADDVVKYHPIREVHLTTWPQRSDIELLLKTDDSVWDLSGHSAEQHWRGLCVTLWSKIKFVMPGERE